MAVILFGAPLLAFSGPLRRLNETTLLTASLVATRRERTAERELLGSNMSAAADAEASASGDMSDPSKLGATAKRSRPSLARAIALLPPIAAGATQLPVRELLKIARGLPLL